MGVHVRAVVGAAVLHQGAPLVLRIVGHEPQDEAGVPMRTCAQRGQSALGERAAVLAESVGERPHRHAVVLTSRRWRGGRDSAVAETRRDNLIYADQHLEGQHARAPDVGRRAVVALGVEHFRREEAQAPGDALREEEARAARVPPAGVVSPKSAGPTSVPSKSTFSGLMSRWCRSRAWVRGWSPVRDGVPRPMRGAARHVLRPRGAGLLQVARPEELHDEGQVRIRDDAADPHQVRAAHRRAKRLNSPATFRSDSSDLMWYLSMPRWRTRRRRGAAGPVWKSKFTARS